MDSKRENEIFNNYLNAFRTDFANAISRYPKITKYLAVKELFRNFAAINYSNTKQYEKDTTTKKDACEFRGTIAPDDLDASDGKGAEFRLNRYDN